MKSPGNLLAAAGIAGALALVAAAPVFAQIPPNCAELCAVSCIKPISIPDRWDDVTAIAGYIGGGRAPNWRNNGKYDSEAFTDLNANGMWDPGEPFTDGNANGAYDRELYDPLTTGYIADPNPSNAFAPAGDLGLELTLHTGSPTEAPTPGQYFSFDLPALNRGTPITDDDQYRANFAGCEPFLVGAGDNCLLEPGIMSGPTNQLMRDLIAQDRDAYWDPGAKQVAGSIFPPGESPRIVRFPAHDPRIGISGLTSYFLVTKVLAFFFEEMTGPATVRGRLLRTTGTGVPCNESPGAAFIVGCATPASHTSWGRIKSTYR